MSEPSWEKRPGYAEIRAARKLHRDSGAWAFFMREIVRLPHEMTPTVLQIIGLERWLDSPDPLEAIRIDAIEAHGHAWHRPASRSIHPTGARHTRQPTR